MSSRIQSLGEVANRYTGILCDVWGVLHNGKSVYQEAALALANYRELGGKVIMLTNSPRPEAGVIEQFDELGVDSNAYDGVVSSGDATRELIQKTKGSVYHLGPSRDKPLFDGLDVALVSDEKCDVIVCTGLFNDEIETPEDYRNQLEKLAKRAVPFICANPDVVVHRGDQLIWCAGALEKLYSELGGQTLVAGKPHKPIYELGQQKINQIAGSSIAKSEILAIGDAMPTDVAGAQNNGYDLLYISAGIHYTEYGSQENPNEEHLAKFLTSHGAKPTVWMPRLRW